MKTPYESAPATAFWKNFVTGGASAQRDEIYRKKFNIARSDRIATAGSCFAQHIAREMRKNGYNVLDVEPPPRGLEASRMFDFGYGMFSARYGNVYTVRQLLQLAAEAIRGPQRETVWEKNGRFYDAFRPSVEPDGLGSRDEVMAHRLSHLAAVRSMFEQMDVFVFTLGLTESWMTRDEKEVYALAPGALAGRFDPNVYKFVNQNMGEIHADFLAFMDLIGRPVRYILTVSPVPLTATASESHVLLANTYSKSVLRAVAGQLSSEYENIDYFPSFEIITSPMARGVFYEHNMRSIASIGVSEVMETFFRHHPPHVDSNIQVDKIHDDVGEQQKCDEEILEGFSK